MGNSNLYVLDLEDNGEGNQSGTYKKFKEQLLHKNNGTYSTRSLWHENHQFLPDNKRSCIARLYNQLCRLKWTPETLNKYETIIKDQFLSGILEIGSENPTGKKYAICCTRMQFGQLPRKLRCTWLMMLQ